MIRIDRFSYYNYIANNIIKMRAPLSDLVARSTATRMFCRIRYDLDNDLLNRQRPCQGGDRRYINIASTQHRYHSHLYTPYTSRPKVEVCRSVLDNTRIHNQKMASYKYLVSEFY